MPGSKLGRGQPRLPDLEEPDPGASRKPDRASRIFLSREIARRLSHHGPGFDPIRVWPQQETVALYAEEAVVTASSVTRCGLHHDVVSITRSVRVELHRLVGRGEAAQH